MKDERSLQGLNWFEEGQICALSYFSTSGCAPCKDMTRYMKGISTQYSERQRVVKIDVDEQIQLAKHLCVKGVPTLVLLDTSGTKARLAVLLFLKLRIG